MVYINGETLIITFYNDFSSSVKIILMARPLVTPVPPQIFHRLNHAGETIWFVYSEQTGLIAPGKTLEEAQQRYTNAEPERMPLDYEPRFRPPQVSAKTTFDFSVFHPLDHWILTPRCRSFYGGARRHLSLWWNYEPGFPNLHYLWFTLRCRLGHHQAIDSWQMISALHLTLNGGGLCAYCYQKMPRPWTNED
jgi:hypothetical protein